MSQVPGTGGVLSGAALKSYLADFRPKSRRMAGLHQQRLSPFFTTSINGPAWRKLFGATLGDRHGDTSA